jgi:2-dehydropantoate 2-reductase
LAEAFDAAGMAGFVHDDVMSSKRGKLLLNLGNALEASLGRGADRGDWPDLVRTEAESVLRGAGLSWDEVGMDAPRRKELMQMGDVPGEARFGGSTSQSLVRGTGRVETDYLNGEIAWLARMNGTEAPRNAFLADIMAEIAASGSGTGMLSLEQMDASYDAWRRGEPLPSLLGDPWSASEIATPGNLQTDATGRAASRDPRPCREHRPGSGSARPTGR